MCVSSAILLASSAMLGVSPSAIDVPAGTELQIRLKSKADTASSKVKDSVDAVVISPVVLNGRVVIPAGTAVKGQISELTRAENVEQRAGLKLTFTELVSPRGKSAKIKSRLIDVDNAREEVDENGRVVGILAKETIASRINQGIAKVAQKNPALAEILETTKATVIKDTNPEIDYGPGVEMTVRLLDPIKWDAASVEQPAIRALGEEENASVYAAVNNQPFRAIAAKTNHPSDITNLMFVGTQQEVEAAFQDAGWSTAHALNDQSVLETFRAIVELRGYKEGPVSVLLLDGVPPDMVFQKQNNTFAMRHHMRVWRRPGTLFGRPIWVAAATHDNGIAFAEEQYTFTHSIDGHIDKERAKIVSDLLFTNRVKSLALVQRPGAPTSGQTSTNTVIETDGRMAVVIF